MFPMKQGHNVLILTPPKSYQAQPHLKELGTEHVLKGPALVLGPPLGPNVAEGTLVRSPAAHDPRFLAQPASHRYPKPLPPTAPLALAALQDLMLPVEATVSWSLSSYSQTVKLAEAGEQGAQSPDQRGFRPRISPETRLRFSLPPPQATTCRGACGRVQGPHLPTRTLGQHARAGLPAACGPQPGPLTSRGSGV